MEEDYSAIFRLKMESKRKHGIYQGEGYLVNGESYIYYEPFEKQLGGIHGLGKRSTLKEAENKYKNITDTPNRKCLVIRLEKTHRVELKP